MEGAEYEIKAGKILIEMPQTSATILKYCLLYTSKRGITTEDRRI